jgi:hypothetical protein
MWECVKAERGRERGTRNIRVPDCVKIGAITSECHVYGIASNIKVLVVKWLMDVTNELASISFDLGIWEIRDHEGSSNDSITCSKVEAQDP